MTTDYNIKEIYSTLADHGLDKKFVMKYFLPEWWDDEIASSKAGFLQTLALLSKNIGIAPEELLNPERVFHLRSPLNIAYKTIGNITYSEKDIWPSSLALRLSDIADLVCKNVYKGFPATAYEFRKMFLERYNKITLINLLDFLWVSGVPVFHVPEFPAGLKKMDGLVAQPNDRPVVILSNNRKHEAWLLFILAHEIGHIQRGHLSGNNNAIFDENVLRKSEDSPEKEATEWALEFLLGRGDILLGRQDINSAFKLFNSAKRAGAELNVDPGCIMLNYAYLNDKFVLAANALNILNPNANAVEVIKSKMRENINSDKLSEEDDEYVSKITSLKEE